MAEEERDSNKTVATTENGKLRAATEAFQRKYRSMSLYGDHVLEAANRSNRALLCLGEDNCIRFYCKKVVESKYPFCGSLCLNFRFIYFHNCL